MLRRVARQSFNLPPRLEASGVTMGKGLGCDADFGLGCYADLFAHLCRARVPVCSGARMRP